MNIFNIFRSKKITETQQEEIEENESGVYFHEDSFNQVEFLPRENLSYLKTENEQIENFAEENFDGHGFKDVYVRKENPMTIADRKIDFAKLDKILVELELEKTSEVYEGYSSARWKCENTFAYTYNRAEIFVTAKNDFVHEFWVNGFRFHEDTETKTKLKEVLLKIGNELNLILNDWDLTVVIDLKNEAETQKYLSEQL